MKKKILIIGIIFIAIIEIIIKYTDSDRNGYYILKDDSIPSIEKVVGKRNLYDKKIQKNKTFIKIYEYNNIEDVYSDLSIYTDYLTNELNFNLTKDFNLNNEKGTIELASSSKKENYILIMKIIYSKGKYSIKITRGKGRIIIS